MNDDRDQAVRWTRRAVAGACLGLLTLGGGAATAQEEPAARDAIPPEQYSISPTGVDMRTGQYTYSNTDLTLGAANGLALVRNNGSNQITFSSRKPFGNFSHNWDIYISERPSAPVAGSSNTVSVYIGGRSDSFITSPIYGAVGDVRSYRSVTARYAGLTATTLPGHDRRFVYTAADHTVIHFRPLNNRDCSGKCAYPTSMVRPDGVRYDFQYDNPNPGQANSGRLRRVTSNLGYAVLFEYFPYSDRNNLVSKACVINLAERVAPAGNICPAGAVAATYNYHANGHLASYTDPTGAVHRFTSTYNKDAVSPFEYDIGFIRPGDATPYLTNRIRRELFYAATKRQTFADGRTVDYVWDEVWHSDTSIEIAGGTYTKNDGSSVSVKFAAYPVPGPAPGTNVTSGPSRITDELGRVTEGDYCLPFRGSCYVEPLKSWTFPEGNRQEFTYDAFHNITETRWKAKPGSGLADIVTTADYDCTNRLLCAKPVYTIDARNNRTDFTYDPVHGGVLTEAGPAAPNGIRPQTRYEYAQRHAWIKSAVGGYGRVTHPVWLLVKQRFCRTTAASGASCAGGAADEVVTTYDYGPDSGPNNLLLRGEAVTADGQTLRTCYGYDAQGRRVSQTAPRANLSSCP